MSVDIGYTGYYMKILENVSLAPYTSLSCGGEARYFAECSTAEELVEAVKFLPKELLTILGYGTNSLISDSGLPGLTIVLRGGEVAFENTLLIADAGVWWDDLIAAANNRKLWGLELTNGVPSSVGGAIMGNIAAYGQQVSDRLVWIDVLDRKTLEVKRVPADEINFAYRKSSLQELSEIIIVKAAFQLSETITTQLTYASALKVAEELSLDPNKLEARAKIILEARRRAGSLYEVDGAEQPRTAGSFFKNPVVTPEQVEQIIAHEERAVGHSSILSQNTVHGGNSHRVSAAHVLLAAGFSRGQTWGNVRLHPKHILKIENIGTATSREIYDVAQYIVATVKKTLDVTLEPEVKFLGEFEGVKIK